MPDIWIDPPNSGFRFGGSFCMRKQCACIRGGAVGHSVCACCLCVPVGLACSFAMSGRGAGLRGDAALLSRFVSVYACCLCVPVGIVCSFAMSGRGAGRRGDAVLLSRFVSVHACCLCVPVGLACSFAMSGCGAGLRGDAALLSRFVLGSRLSFFLCQEKRDGLRCLAFLFRAGRDRHSCVLAVLAQLSGLAGSLRVCAFLYGDPDGLPGTRDYEETGLAARPLCAFAWAHWPCRSFRREYAGAKSGSRTAAAPDCAKESSTLWTLLM